MLPATETVILLQAEGAVKVDVKGPRFMSVVGVVILRRGIFEKRKCRTR